MNIFKQRCILVLSATFLGLCGCSSDVTERASQEARPLPLIAAPGSMGSNLVRGSDGSIVLSWIEPAGEGHALRHSRFADDSWSAPRTVVSGDHWFINWADFPSVVPVSESLWAAHWLVSQAAGGYAYDVRTAVSTDGGNTWSDSIIPHSDNTDTEHGFVTIFADDGKAGLLWLDGRKMVNEYDENDKRASGMTLRAARIDDQITLSDEALVDDLACDCCQTDVAVTSDGPVAIYRDRTENEIRDIYVSRQVGGKWQAGVPVAEDLWNIAACPVNGPVIQADGSTVAAAWFTAPDESPHVRVAWSDDAGRTFGPPIDVSAARPLGHVGSALLLDGDLALTWLRAKGGGAAELVIARIARDGTVGVPHVLTEAADVFAFSVPQLTRREDRLIVAWTTEVDGVYGIASALVPASIL